MGTPFINIKLKIQTCLVIAAVSFSQLAMATVFKDVVNLNQKIGWFETVTYTHDISDDGYSSGGYELNKAKLKITLGDDSRWDFYEVALVEVADLLKMKDIGQKTIFKFGLNDRSNGFLELALNGTIRVSVTSATGDFYLRRSQLVARATAVPEPGLLSLLGLGLVGMALRSKA